MRERKLTYIFKKLFAHIQEANCTVHIQEVNVHIQEANVHIPDVNVRIQEGIVHIQEANCTHTDR